MINKQDLELAVVRVWHGKPNESGSHIGSAFRITSTHFITAKHVIWDVPREDLYLQGRPWTGLRNVAAVELHPDRDIAVLKLHQPDENDPCIDAAETGAQQGDNVTLAGYSSAINDLEIRPLVVTNYDGDCHAWVLSPFLGRGMSGGPALREDGRLVGLIQARDTDRNVTYIIPLDSFLPLIRHLTGYIANDSAVKALGDIEYTREGEEICIDRRWEVVTFRRMIYRDQAIQERALAFQVPGGKGKTRLLRRFNRICESNVQQGKPILYALLDFRDKPVSPYGLSFELVNKIILNAERSHPELSDKLDPIRTLADQIEKSEQRSTKTGRKSVASEIDKQKLAQNMISCFRIMSEEWTFVLMMDSLEHAGEGREWYLRYCLPESADLDGIISVLASRRGLSQLENSYQVILRTVLEPMQNWEDCQLLAKRLHDLSISKELSLRIIDQYKGDIQSIDTCLGVFKNFPDMFDSTAQFPGSAVPTPETS